MNLAAKDMKAQFEEGDGYAYNLHRMWRAAGSPADRGPRRWAEIASPFIAGVKLYMRNLDRLHGLDPQDDEPIGTAGDAGQCDGYVEGEVFAHSLIAHAYAMFLDGTDGT